MKGNKEKEEREEKRKGGLEEIKQVIVERRMMEKGVDRGWVREGMVKILVKVLEQERGGRSVEEGYRMSAVTVR